jgi:hypothetical protein
MSLRLSSTGALSPGSFHGATIRRELLYFQVFLDICYVAFRVPSREVLPRGSPTGPLRRQLLVSRAFFYISIGFPNKHCSLVTQNFTFLSKSPVKLRLLHGSPTGPLWVSRDFLYIYFIVHNKGALFPGFYCSHREKHSVSRTLLRPFLKFPG